MKTLLLAMSLFISYSSFAAGAPDPVTNPSANSPMAADADASDDKTLLNKPEGDPCKTDVPKLCSHLKNPNKAAIRKCLKEHKSELSASCKAKGDWMKKEFIEKRKEDKANSAK